MSTLVSRRIALTAGRLTDPPPVAGPLADTFSNERAPTAGTHPPIQFSDQLVLKRCKRTATG